MTKTAPQPPKGTPQSKYAVCCFNNTGERGLIMCGHTRDKVLATAISLNWRNPEHHAYPVAITSRGQRVRIGDQNRTKS